MTLLSYLHIAFQPIVINLFAMELVPAATKRRAFKPVLAITVAVAVLMVLQLAPAEAFGSCIPGTPLCGASLCTVAGDWHIAWDIPYNGMMVPFEGAFGFRSGFPQYMAAVFVLPLVYGAWRFVLIHAIAGPILAWSLTSDPNEMPAIWCLFSIAILTITLSPAVRRSVSARTWWGVAVS